MKRNLSFENLEEKKLLAADISLSAEGELQILGSDQNDSVIVQQSSDAIQISINGERVSFDNADVSSLYFEGGEGNDTFVNRTSLDSLAYGNRGQDRLVGGPGVDEFHGGPDDDRLYGSGGNDSLHGDYGDDRIYGGEGDDSIYGWYGNDYLLGHNGNDYISGYLGNDELRGGNGNDTLKGHDGNDLLLGEAGNDRIYGWRGQDRLIGGAGNDILSAWSGDDIVVGGTGNDYIKGHAGDDLIVGGTGVDKIDAGSGEDFVITGSTKIDSNLEELDLIHTEWLAYGTTPERLEGLNDFIRTQVAWNDRASDQIFDNREELDLFVHDGFDQFHES